MRKEAKANKSATITNVQGYHSGSWNGNYAYQGFGENRYFTSDRFIRLDDNFNRPDGKPLKGFGLEIESECNGISNQTVLAEVLNKVIFSHFPEHLFKLQNDGSLSGESSAECITQVMTREFVRNNYANFKLMYNTYFPAFGISCGANCGMHCNISNAVFGRTQEAQATAIRKLYYFVNAHYDLCCSLLHRDHRRTSYCRRMSADKNACKVMDLGGYMSNHGVSFNLGHYNEGRIELRLVGGQSNFACFRNTMESLFHLCDAVKRLSWNDLDDFVKVFEGCNQFVFDRLNSFCRDHGDISDRDLDAIRATVKREELL